MEKKKEKECRRIKEICIHKFHDTFQFILHVTVLHYPTSNGGAAREKQLHFYVAR